MKRPRPVKRPRLLACAKCGRKPHYHWAYRGLEDERPEFGPFIISCECEAYKGKHYFVRSWDKQRAVRLWNRSQRFMALRLARLGVKR